MEYKRITLDYKSLEPYIDDRTLDLHYNAHYRNYTDKLNKYLNDINYDYKDSPEYLAKHIDILPMENRDEILFNLGGYLNHSLYFYNLTNKKKDIPIEEGRYFIEDLKGCSVYDTNSKKLYGELIDVFNTGASDIYSVKDSSGKEYLIPILEGTVSEINLEKHEIYLLPIEGIFDV